MLRLKVCSVVAGLVAGLALVSAPAASADVRPLDDGGMIFPKIQSPADPEEYGFEVQLGEDQELKEIDDRDAAVYYEGGDLAFTITAVEAHDAVGTNVPTTLAVTQPNLLTLTVHHRAGNPAAGGAPFDYPVVEGAGWEGGFQTVVVSFPPGEQPPATTCTVPSLHGLTSRGARRRLQRAGCALGPVRGNRSRGARVVRQYRAAGKSLPAGAPVGIKLGS